MWHPLRSAHARKRRSINLRIGPRFSAKVASSRLAAQCRLCGGEARDGHPERRTAHVIEAFAVTKVDRRRLAAVLAANSNLQVGLGLAPALDADADELAEPVLVDGDERIGRVDAEPHVFAQKSRG